MNTRPAKCFSILSILSLVVCACGGNSNRQLAGSLGGHAESGGSTSGARTSVGGSGGANSSTSAVPSGGSAASGGSYSAGGVVAIGGTNTSGGATLTSSGGGLQNTGGKTTSATGIGGSATGGTSATVSSGGTPGTGGTLGTAGTRATGGTPASGGNRATGGTTSTGGLPASGGSSSTGGTRSVSGSGGATNSGGTPGTGGTSRTGGAGGGGGAVTGGASSSAPCGSSAPPNFGQSCGFCNGTVACDASCTRADTSCAPVGPSVQFRSELIMSSDVPPADHVLDAYSGAPFNAFVNTNCCSGGVWSIDASPTGGYIISNHAYTDTAGFHLALESHDDGSGSYSLQLTSVPSNFTAPTPEQTWTFTALAGGKYRLTNAALGTGWSLQAPLDIASWNYVSMAATADTPAQRWVVSTF